MLTCIVFYHAIWDLPGSWYDKWSSNETWTCSYYVIRLWMLFKLLFYMAFYVTALSREGGGWGVPPCYCLVKAEVQVSQLASNDAWGGSPHYCWVQVGVQASCTVSTDNALEGSFVTTGRWWNISLSNKPLLTQPQSGREVAPHCCWVGMEVQTPHWHNVGVGEREGSQPNRRKEVPALWLAFSDIILMVVLGYFDTALWGWYLRFPI